ncbi:unnamed protein product [Closterium sp. NIES-65]|nr:unnamed protein product [Closterium sp. NIES-65]
MRLGEGAAVAGASRRAQRQFERRWSSRRGSVSLVPCARLRADMRLRGLGWARNVRISGLWRRSVLAGGLRRRRASAPPGTIFLSRCCTTNQVNERRHCGVEAGLNRQPLPHSPAPSPTEDMTQRFWCWTTDKDNHAGNLRVLHDAMK